MDYPRINEQELKFPIPCGIIVSGPSSSGKTQLVLRLLSRAVEMFAPPPKAIVWAYGEYSAQIPELERQGIIVHAGAPSDEMLNKLPKPFLIVYDDLMGEIDAKKLADLYTKKSHHNNFAVIFLTQNLFDKAMRVPRSNAQYIFLMRAPNDMLSIRNLATQIFPREQGFLIDAYKQACAEPYGPRDICFRDEKMANKLILLPVEHYKGLVAAREKVEDDVTDQTNFGFVKQQFEKAKRKRAANVSEKSAEYNQQLRRYLKLRKEVKDKPVKVQLSNGMRLMTKPPATGVQLKPGPEEVEETIVIGGSEADDDEPAAISSPKFSTPKEVEAAPEPRVSRKRDLKKQEIMAKKEKLLSIIKSNPTRTIPGGFMTDVQADLADFQALSRKNSGNRYLLLAVDVLSRRMFGVPVKSKKPAEMKRAFEELFGQMPKLPETLYTDRGLEFVAKPLKDFYAEKGIKKFETNSKKKAAVAERAIRTLKTRLYKYFSAKNTSTWVDVLAKFLAAINNSVCRATGLKPSDIDEQNAREVWKKVYGETINLPLQIDELLKSDQ
uniref:Integrase catalytic domain-containing protein n=1 Tax=Globodera rostochiensis TaxID=31243 RepID=A0A914I9T7_GLORO